MPDFVHDKLVDPSRTLWQVEHGFSNTDFNGLTYQQVMEGRSRAGMTIDDLWPNLTNVDDAQQFIADMIATSGRLTMQRNIKIDPTKPKWARVCGSAKPCAFCVMLASRGFAYNSQETADFGSGFHDGHCHCSVVPSWGKNERLLSKQAQWKRMYDSAAESAKHAKEKKTPENICVWLRYNFPGLLKDGVVFDPDMRIPKGSRFEKQLGNPHVFRMNQLLKQAAKNGHENTVRLWSKYAGDYEIIDSDYSDTANFNPAAGGISINRKAIGFQSAIHTPYQVIFHESSHMLDWLLNGKTVEQYSELTFPDSTRGEFVQALWADATRLRSDSTKELDDIWRGRLKEINEAETYLSKYHRLPRKTIIKMISESKIKMETDDLEGSGHTSLLRAALLKWRTEVEGQIPTSGDIMMALQSKVHEDVSKRGAADLDDMIQAWFTDYNDYAYAGHFSEGYWDKSSRPHEAFAEMMSAQIVNPESWEHIQHWFPESAKMFQDMVKEAMNR